MVPTYSRLSSAFSASNSASDINSKSSTGESKGPSSRLLILFVLTLALFEVGRKFTQVMKISTIHDGDADTPTQILFGGKTTTTTRRREKIIIGYAVSVTHFTMEDHEKSKVKLLDRAAVLHQSIKLAMEKSPTYDYHIYAFVHPNAVECIPIMTLLGYRVQVRDTPFNITDISNPELIKVQDNGCCDEREYIKLYSYLLLDYPVVVHLDLDSIVLRPMDDLFNLMTTKTRFKKEDTERFARTSTMWLKHNNTKNISWSSSLSTDNILTKPEQINFMFTRDYNMVDPPRKKVYQIGVQGGFLFVRPNRRDFDRMVNIILSGGGFSNSCWGGELGYGGYYGAGTIQGLASFYYDYHENSKRSIELNRCYYNTMVDAPYHFDKKQNKNICRTTENTCQDCGETKLEEIYTSHFTVCGKPEWCLRKNPKKSEQERLCYELFREWHMVRLTVEIDWVKRFDGYVSLWDDGLNSTTELRQNYLKSSKMGYCKDGEYIPLQFPYSNETANNGYLDLIP